MAFPLKNQDGTPAKGANGRAIRDDSDCCDCGGGGDCPTTGCTCGVDIDGLNHLFGRARNPRPPWTVSLAITGTIRRQLGSSRDGRIVDDQTIVIGESKAGTCNGPNQCITMNNPGCVLPNENNRWMYRILPFAPNPVFLNGPGNLVLETYIDVDCRNFVQTSARARWPFLDPGETPFWALNPDRLLLAPLGFRWHLFASSDMTMQESDGGSTVWDVAGPGNCMLYGVGGLEAVDPACGGFSAPTGSLLEFSRQSAAHHGAAVLTANTTKSAAMNNCVVVAVSDTVTVYQKNRQAATGMGFGRIDATINATMRVTGWAPCISGVNDEDRDTASIVSELLRR